jgi:hypothetical protein
VYPSQNAGTAVKLWQNALQTIRNIKLVDYEHLFSRCLSVLPDVGSSLSIVLGIWLTKWSWMIGGSWIFYVLFILSELKAHSASRTSDWKCTSQALEEL